MALTFNTAADIAGSPHFFLPGEEEGAKCQYHGQNHLSRSQGHDLSLKPPESVNRYIDITAMCLIAHAPNKKRHQIHYGFYASDKKIAPLPDGFRHEK